MSVRDEIRFSAEALRRLPWPVARFVVRARARARRDGDVFSLDSALRPAKLEALLEAAAGRRAVVELGTGTAWATVALAPRSPTRPGRSRAGIRWCASSGTGTSTSAARTCAGGSPSSRGWGSRRTTTRRGPALHRQLARARADAGGGRRVAPRARARRADRVRRLRPPGLPGRRRRSPSSAPTARSAPRSSSGACPEFSAGAGFATPGVTQIGISPRATATSDRGGGQSRSATSTPPPSSTRTAARAST